MADPPPSPAAGERNPRGNTPGGTRQSSNGSSCSGSQRRRGGRNFSHSPRGTFQGRSSGANNFHHQVYRPKIKPIESQNVENVNALVSKFESEKTIRDGDEISSFDGLAQSIDSKEAVNVNSLASKFDAEDACGGRGERSSVDGLSVGVLTPSEDKCGEDKEESEGCKEEVKQCFDICLRKKGSGVVLKAPLFQKNKERRNEMKRASEGLNWFVLRPGMVILKNYLLMDDQIKIVNRCRELGLGAGGFYQPGYHDGGRLNLRMMCLGKHWDPNTSMYGDYRPDDDAKPPIIPREFQDLVVGSIRDAQSLIERTCKGRNVKEILPSMLPDICIVNFYSLSGRLGLHQDKDESEESIHKGLPVVSFSIGESAEFLYGNHRDADRAEKVILESGDVLIFGGKSRLIFHGVSSIQKGTAPRTLLDQTSLRPGRLNLTFRQY